MPILTPDRLLSLSSNPVLSASWYYIAAVALTVCNQPQELPQLYHHLLRGGTTPIQAQEAIDSALAYQKLSDRGMPMPLTPSANTVAIQQMQTDKLKEALVKTIALAGVPRVINALMTLKTATPTDLRLNDKPVRSTLDDAATVKAERLRGYAFWDKVYGKISNRVAHQMSSASPDLWAYTINHVYAPLLSCTDVLSARESSFVVIACLVPQDVNPQLKGHLKGAISNGCTLEEVRATRAMVMQVCEWCGVGWKAEVAKL